MGETEEDDRRAALIIRLCHTRAILVHKLKRPANIGGGALLSRLRDDEERHAHQRHKADSENDQRQEELFLLRCHENSEAALQSGERVEENHRAEMPPQQASCRGKQSHPDPGHLPDDLGQLAIGGGVVRLCFALRHHGLIIGQEKRFCTGLKPAAPQRSQGQA